MNIRQLTNITLKKPISEEHKNEIQRLFEETQEYWLLNTNTPSRIPYYIRSGSLFVFLSEKAAKDYVDSGEYTTGNEIPEKINPEELSELVREFHRSCAITDVTLTLFGPVTLNFENADSFSDDLIASKEGPVSFSRETQKIAKILDAFDEQDRQKIDPNYKMYMANAHLLVKHLMKKLGIKASEIGYKANIHSEKIMKFCEDLGNSSLMNREEFKSLFTYFNLEMYINRFSTDCDELDKEIHNHSSLNHKPLVFTNIDDIPEVFTITQVTRGTYNESYIYKIDLAAKTRSVTIYLTDPTGCVKGRPCGIQNLEKVVPDNPDKNETQKSQNITEEKIHQVISEFEQEKRTPRRYGTKINKQPYQNRQPDTEDEEI